MAVPRATEWMHRDGAFGPYFRLRCECCGCPTLDAGTLDVHEVSWPQVCLLCEWENAAPRSLTPHSERPLLDAARAQFRRFSWMYDPAQLPEWLTVAPSAEELQARDDLREVYAAIDEEPNGPRFLELWEIVHEAEIQLMAIARARVALEIEAAEAGATTSDELSLADLMNTDDQSHSADPGRL